MTNWTNLLAARIFSATVGSNLKMAEVFSLYAAKTHLSQQVDRAAAGEEIIISKSGKPFARLMPLPSQAQPRKPAGALGRIVIREDFDAPLPPEIMDAFVGR